MSERMRFVGAVLMAATTIGIFSWMSCRAKADGCHVVRRNQVIISSGAVVTPFAVPVAVPTSVVVQGYTYSHREAAQAYGTSDDAKLFAEFLEWRKVREANQVKALGSTLLAQNCAKCHAENKDAKAHLDMSGPLSSEQKLAAIAAIMSGKMPKSKTLDPQVRADLVAELSGVKPQGESK